MLTLLSGGCYRSCIATRHSLGESIMKNLSNPVRVLARASLLAFACAACGTVSVRVPVMKPAEINMAPYNSVAVGGLSGSGNGPMSDSLEEALVSSQRFTVV